MLYPSIFILLVLQAAVEAMLRTGVQSQLEGIRTAIAHLHTASEDIVAIETGSVPDSESLLSDQSEID